jgi:hypothetical protein
VYWRRYGQAPPGGDVSGLEGEFDLSARLPKLLYVKEPAPAATRGSPSCWTGSGRRGRFPIAPSAGPLSWAGWCVMTWRSC